MNVNPLLKSLFIFYFFILYRTDLIFINQISFFLFFTKHIWFLPTKSHFFYPLQNRSISINQKSFFFFFFYLLQNRFDFYQPNPIFPPYKTDLIFINQIPFFFYPSQNTYDFLLTKSHFSQLYITNLIFFFPLRRGHIHRWIYLN